MTNVAYRAIVRPITCERTGRMFSSLYSVFTYPGFYSLGIRLLVLLSVLHAGTRWLLFSSLHVVLMASLALHPHCSLTIPTLGYSLSAHYDESFSTHEVEHGVS